LRPVEFDCAPPVAGKCGTRGQRFEPESLETVSILSPSEGAGEWERAVEVASEVLTVTDEPAATEPVMEASPEVASDEPAPATDEPAATETETPAPKGKRSRKG
jgi:hypothetical protein